MKAFRYNLEKVLDLRNYYEEEAKIELGRAIGVLSELESRLFAVGQELVRAAEAQFNPENGLTETQQYMLYLMRLEYTKEQLLKEIALAELKVEEARKTFLEASRERKVLEKHKEKQKEEHKKKELAGQTKELDDISSAIFARQSG